MNSKIVQIIREDTLEVYNFQTITTTSQSYRSTITTYPTTEGTPRADHIYTEPTSITASFNIGGSEDITDEWGSSIDRPKTALMILKEWRDLSIPLTIVTNQSINNGMYLTGISISNTINNAYDLNGALTFNELLISNFETITVGPFISEETESSNSSTTNSGENNGTENNSVNETILQKVVKAPFIFGPIVAGGVLIGNIVKKAISWLKGSSSRPGRW